MTLWMLWSILTSTLIALAGIAFERAAILLRAPRRYVWIAVLVATIVVPVIFGLRRTPTASERPSTTSLVERHAPPTAAAAQTMPNTAPTSRSSSPVVGDETRRLSFQSRATLAAWTQSIQHFDEWIAVAWLVASTVLLLSLVATMVRLHVRRARWTTTETEVGPVHVSTDLGPAVVGFFRPRIVLPEWALSMESTPRRLLLQHELEHLRVNDTRTLIASEVALALFPWNAAMWWIVRRTRVAVEIDCDARVIESSANAHDYGAMLLEVSAHFVAAEPLAASLLERRAGLDARIAAIVEPRGARRIVTALPFLAIAGMTLGTAGWTPRPAPLLHAREAKPPMTASAPATTPAPGTVMAQRQAPIARAAQPTATPPRDIATPSAEPRVVVPHILQPEDSVLAAVGYMARKQAGRGFFIDGGGINHETAPFSELLRAVPGFRVSSTGAAADAETAADGCVTTFVDGVPWEEQAPGDIDGFVRPSELIALEAYRRAEVPPQFASRDGRACATVVVWTKNRLARRNQTSSNIDRRPDLFGTWSLDVAKSEATSLPASETRTLALTDGSITIEYAMTEKDVWSRVTDSYALDGSPSANHRVTGIEGRTSALWSDSILVLTTTWKQPAEQARRGQARFLDPVSGMPFEVNSMTERYVLSADRARLTVERRTTIADRSSRERLVFARK